VTRPSAIARREFGLFVQKNPDLSKLTPEQRGAVGRFLGIHPDNLEAAYALAMQQPRGGPTDADLAKLSAIDRRAMTLGQNR
jgi:hypothetical protein